MRLHTGRKQRITKKRMGKAARKSRKHVEFHFEFMADLKSGS